MHQEQTLDCIEFDVDIRQKTANGHMTYKGTPRFQARDFLTCLSRSLPCLNLAVKITFAKVESVVSQQVVGGRHMKI